ncbi:MAG TPA: hypothetical protein DCK76_01140 [Desulfotomaculum sp.]|nr:hypothetical protein [Desulfotomaculum sp.]HBY04533.1 hypothetical protein [Desulfotomaculum sp.]
MLAHQISLCKWQQIRLPKQAADPETFFKSRSLKPKEGILIGVKRLAKRVKNNRYQAGKRVRTGLYW